MSSRVDVAPPAQEDSDIDLYFAGNGKEESLSLWPLNDDPVLVYDPDSEPDGPNWNSDPSHFTLLWRTDTTTNIPRHTAFRIPGPLICTNLFGRTPAQAFANFPTKFDEFDSRPSSPTLSPVSAFDSPSSASDENSRGMRVIDLPDLVDDDVDELSLQLTDRMHLDSPVLPSPSFQLSEDDILPSTPLSPPTCDLLSVNSPFDGVSPSSTLVASSNASSTCAPSPSPGPFLMSSSSSPAHGSSASLPPEPYSPRMASQTPIPTPEVAEPGEHLIHGAALLLVAPESSYPLLVPPPNQIVLEEHPVEDVARHRAATRGLHTLKPEDPRSHKNSRSTKKPTKAVKRYPCTVPGCNESFTRLNDVLRHVKNAAIHKSERTAGPFCSKCGEELSRPDAARRHEAKGACKKRTITKPSTYALLPA
ncbi:hypothetical protein MSAN_01679800 [Mycena sanguinolenta]|uniref:C2H2-type domain-containing protein n=1 Tax=Mycena sanguinolenta TaxID=230812 RepID=A0A8H6Y392_9AGAR|nr:hypothetical protein MSAN_01679800 [Mycena sanguinolenta]